MPKIEFVKLKYRREVKGNIKSVTISKNTSGKYYISILTEQNIEKFPVVTKKIGIDLELKDFIITSNSEKIANPKFLRSTEKN